MPDDQLKFWITCPACRHVFGVEPRAVVQYLNRVLGTLAGPPARQAPETPPPTDAPPDAPAHEEPPNATPANRPAGRPEPYRRSRPWSRTR